MNRLRGFVSSSRRYPPELRERAVRAFDLAGRDLIGEHHRKGSEVTHPHHETRQCASHSHPPAARRGTAAARTAPGTPSSGDDAANAGAPRPPTSGTESRPNAASTSAAAPATMTTGRIRFVPYRSG